MYLEVGSFRSDQNNLDTQKLFSKQVGVLEQRAARSFTSFFLSFFGKNHDRVPSTIRPVLKARPFLISSSVFVSFFVSLFLYLFLYLFISPDPTRMHSVLIFSPLLQLTFYPHFLYTLDTLQVHSSSIWVSTALATFACKRKPSTVYLLLFLIFPF